MSITMKRNKIIKKVIIISIVIVIGSISECLYLLQANYKTIGMELIDINKKNISFELVRSARYIKIILESNSSDEVEVIIKDPTNKEVLNKYISDNKAIEVELTGKKGDWNIEFENLTEDLKIKIEYKITASNFIRYLNKDTGKFN